MKIRQQSGGEAEKIEIQMTPMIDIVFQLLVFFIMTFKIVSQEGDFNIMMPLAAPPGQPQDVMPVTIKLRMTAVTDEEAAARNLRPGELKAVTFNDDQNYSAKYTPELDANGNPTGINVVDAESTFYQIHNRIFNIVSSRTGSDSPEDDIEVNLDCDYTLRYERVVNAITAVSGHMDSNGNIVKLVEKINFSRQ